MNENRWRLAWIVGDLQDRIPTHTIYDTADDVRAAVGAGTVEGTDYIAVEVAPVNDLMHGLRWRFVRPDEMRRPDPAARREAARIAAGRAAIHVQGITPAQSARMMGDAFT